MDDDHLTEDRVLELGVVNLRTELEYRNLSTRGRKPELTLRLLKVVMAENASEQTTAPTSPTMSARSEEGTLAQLLAQTMSISRLPTPEPPVFKGDPSQYRDWKVAYDTLIENKPIAITEKMFYLKQYTSGAAREAITGYFVTNSETAYKSAKDVLHRRYGSDYIVTEAMRDQLDQWPTIRPKDPKGLRAFADYLATCLASMEDIPDLSILNDVRENRKLQAKLPDRLRNSWAKIVYDKREDAGVFPTFERFVKFLQREADIACDPTTQAERSQSYQHRSNDAPRARNLATSLTEDCLFCKRTNHQTPACHQLAKATSNDQQEFVKKNGLCFGCLGKGHRTRDCTNRATCEKCGKPHPTSLHYEPRTPSRQSPEPAQAQASDRPQEVTSHTVASPSSASLTSMIVPVWVSHPNQPGKEVLTYAMLDSQSDATFVSNDVIEELQAPVQRAELRITTMTSKQALVQTSKVSDLVVRGYGRSRSTPVALPTSYTRKEIPVSRDHIPTSDQARKWKHLKKIADQIPPLQRCAVGILIGYNCPYAMAPVRHVIGKPGEPFAIETEIGWSIVGGVCTAEQTPHSTSYRIQTVSKEDIAPRDILNVLDQDFRDLGECDKKVSQEDIQFVQLLNENTTIDSHGYYTMPLPFRQRPSLPNNREYAKKRLNAQSRRMTNNPQYYEKYNQIITDLVANDHAELVPFPDPAIPESCWYLPHHGVDNPKKPGKLRVVYDCSARYRSQALNDHLLQGPDLTNGLIGVLCRFRKGQVAITCDVEKMFYQFKVPTQDRDYLRFLWYADSSRTQVLDYRMKVHIFGATSSPGCATFGLRRLASDYADEFGDAASFIHNDFYVDDGLTSTSTPEQATNLIDRCRTLCSKGNLRLHKFASNDQSVIASLNKQNSNLCVESTASILLNSDPAYERALGILWNTTADVFTFSITPLDKTPNPATRRALLSTISSIYDPLGFVSPFVLKGKLILQQLCKESKGWDEPVQEPLLTLWQAWEEERSTIVGFKIQRCMFPKDFGDPVDVQLHHFSDASSIAYGQTSYIRAQNASGDVHVGLIFSKSRVLPLKPMTIPRAELQAAVLSVKVSRLLREELRYELVSEHFWTDSMIVLGYIFNDAKRFHTYVANRIQSIHTYTKPSQWHHVPTADNPADVASRGATPSQLMDCGWIQGPQFLHEAWSAETTEAPLLDEDPEVRSVGIFASGSAATSIMDNLKRFSKWTSLIKGVCFIKRYIRRWKSNRTIVTRSSIQPKTVQDIVETERTLIAISQAEAYEDEIMKLRRGDRLHHAHHLYKLQPFLDQDGIMRVGGRLTRSTSLSKDMIHPIILPKKCHVSQLIASCCHAQAAHQGRLLTMNTIRSKGYWIVGCRSVVATLIHACTLCRKLRGKKGEQLMAELPVDRLEPSPPFSYCGYDCFGPFHVTDGRKQSKRYGLIVTCLASRAIHIELLDDMSTDSFIGGLRCFIALRGPPRKMTSDQGSNFKGAINELQQAMKEVSEPRLREFLLLHKCDFVMNVPHASHMGGVWERNIRSVRTVLTGLLKTTAVRLTTNALRTLLYESMAIVNSRPLTSDGIDDSNGPEPLAPNHLLTMKSGCIPPPAGTFEQSDLYGRKQWRKVQYLADQFWRRWRREYLSTLQARQKWNKPQRDFSPGDIVLIVDEKAVRTEWPLGKVLKTFPSADHRVRSVELAVGCPTIDSDGKRRSKLSVWRRPIHKLVFLTR